jgi:hypothetical protein
MSPNTLPAGIQNLLQLADAMAQGLARHGPWIGLAQIPADDFRVAAQQLRDAENALAGARSAKTMAGKRVIMADKALVAWLTKARLVVMLARGVRWSESWILTGFTHHRTNVPKRVESRIALARALVSFFARHPEFGVAFADVTAARGREIYERVTQSREILRVMTSDCATSKQERDAAGRVLRDVVREVASVLSATIDASDPRWLDFGLNLQESRVRQNRVRIDRPTASPPISFVRSDPGDSRNIAAA